MRRLREHAFAFLAALSVAAILLTGRHSRLPLPACRTPYLLPFWTMLTVVFGALWWSRRRRTNP
jgi:hypothetical protein